MSAKLRNCNDAAFTLNYFKLSEVYFEGLLIFRLVVSFSAGVNSIFCIKTWAEWQF